MMQRIRFPDFDTLVALHQDDAQAFEAFRRHLLNDAVDCAPPSRRPALRQLVRRMDMASSSAATPLEASAIAFEMMRQSLHELQSAWQQAQHACAALQTGLLLEKIRQ